MGIKDFLPEQASFCKCNWEVVAYIITTGKGRSGPDIWLKTLNQGTNSEYIILKI